MAKPNLLALRRPPRATRTLFLQDPGQPDVVPFPLTLQSLDAYDQTLLVAEAQAWAAEFADTGLPIAGEVIQITLEVAQAVCAVELMQAGPEEDRFGRVELLALMLTMPAAWGQIMQVSGELLQGNAPGTTTKAESVSPPSPSPSAPPSTSTPGTPNQSPTYALSGGA